MVKIKNFSKKKIFKNKTNGMAVQTRCQTNNKQQVKNIFCRYKSFDCKFLILGIFFITLLISFFTTRNFGFNKGIDFAGGVVIEASCKNCDINTISNQISKKLKTSIQHQKIDNGYLFKSKTTEGYETIFAVFNEVLKKNNEKIISTDFASAQMSKTFLDDSIFACIFAFICIGLYLFVRFNWKFSLSAILSLIYDVLMVICFISVAKIEVCLITLTAILTIIGYCINDKIVVFDRIRENLDEKSKTIQQIINESVKNVLMRSILTSLTTIVATISLLFFGDRLIYELGLTIIFGVFIGTITSLLLAPNLLLLFKIKHRTNLSEVKDPMWYAS